MTSQFNRSGAARRAEPVPWLGALVCSSPFDLALHDAFGVLHGVPDLRHVQRSVHESGPVPFPARPRPATDVSFDGPIPRGVPGPPPTASRSPAWHLVGGKDPIDPWDLTGSEPDDGYPVLLRDWIRRDGLKCLKVKLRGDDADWDYDRLLKVGRIAVEEGVDWLTADFNCTVHEPAYVNAILDRLLDEHPRLYGMLLYVEQPFPYDLEGASDRRAQRLGAQAALHGRERHDWRFVRLGRELGWSGVALKTCKTQTGALLSLCWARAHGMTLMVQDLSNPMLAQVSHVLLAAHAGTIMGVESNGMQFYPAASLPEARPSTPASTAAATAQLDLSTVRGPGFGYRIDEIERTCPSRPSAPALDDTPRPGRNGHSSRLTIREMCCVSSRSNACSCSALSKIRFGMTVNWREP